MLKPWYTGMLQKGVSFRLLWEHRAAGSGTAWSEIAGGRLEMHRRNRRRVLRPRAGAIGDEIACSHALRSILHLVWQMRLGVLHLV